MWKIGIWVKVPHKYRISGDIPSTCGGVSLKLSTGRLGINTDNLKHFSPSHRQKRYMVVVPDYPPTGGGA